MKQLAEPDLKPITFINMPRAMTEDWVNVISVYTGFSSN